MFKCHKCGYTTNNPASWFQHKAWCWIEKAVELFNEVK